MSGSYWQREAGWCDRWHDAAVPSSVEIAVLGGGLAGLTTAIRLREKNPGATIAVLEAERVGFGASGRSAGFLSPLAAPVWLLGAERSPDQAWAAARINADVHAIARWLGEHVPDCELRPASLSLEAAGRVAGSALGEFARAVEHVGLAHQFGPSRTRPGHLVLHMDAYTLHPYKLVRGLAEHAVRAGVIVRERARVRSVTAEPIGARVRLDDGTQLHARRVVVCTNAYTSSIDVGDRVAAAVIHSFMTATAPLEAAARRALVRDGDFTVEVNAAQVYHRMHGNRIIYGGIDKVRAPPGGELAVPASVRAKLASLMQASFPTVVGLTADDAWSGRFHATATGLPIIRTSELNPSVVFNVGYGGTGVALALTCAPLAAGVAAGGLVPCSDDARLLAVIHATRISVLDSLRAVTRIAGRLAQPWAR